MLEWWYFKKANVPNPYHVGSCSNFEGPLVLVTFGIKLGSVALDVENCQKPAKLMDTFKGDPCLRH